MKTYQVNVDITMSVVEFIDAKSEEEAKQILLEKIKNNPYNYIRNGAFLDAQVTDVFESKEE